MKEQLRLAVERNAELSQELAETKAKLTNTERQFYNLLGKGG